MKPDGMIYIHSIPTREVFSYREMLKYPKVVGSTSKTCYTMRSGIPALFKEQKCKSTGYVCKNGPKAVNAEK